MKRLAIAFALVFGLLSATALADDFTGYITDAKCAASGKDVRSEGHAKCAAGCIKGGQPAVLAAEDGQVYKLDDQEKVKEHAGHKVTITGKLEGDTIKVESVKM